MKAKQLCYCGKPATWVLTWPDDPSIIGFYCDEDVLRGLTEDKATLVERYWLWEKRTEEEIRRDMAAQRENPPNL